MRKWDAVTQGELFSIIENLKQAYDPDLARKVIELFLERMRDGEHIDHDVLAYWMEHVFAQIIAGKSADQAFGLKPVRGADKQKDTEDRDMLAVAIFVLHMRHGIQWRNLSRDSTNNAPIDPILQTSKGKWEEALADAAVSLEISESTVQRACSQYLNVLEMLSDGSLLQFNGIKSLSQ